MFFRSIFFCFPSSPRPVSVRFFRVQFTVRQNDPKTDIIFAFDVKQAGTCICVARSEGE